MSSRVRYGVTTAYGSVAGASAQVTAHTVTVTGLKPATEYHFQACGYDAAGAYAASPDFTFTTQATASVSKSAHRTQFALSASGVKRVSRNAAAEGGTGAVSYPHPGAPRAG